MSKTSGPDYDRPVRLQTLTWHKAVAIWDQPTGGSQMKDHLDARQGYVIELHLHRRYVRMWSTRYASSKVTTMLLGENDSWTIEGDCEQQPIPAPEGPRAA